MLTDLFPDSLRLQTYADLCETLQLDIALQKTLKTLSPILPADGVFANIFMKDTLSVQFLAHATHEVASKFDHRVPVSHDWLKKMSYDKRSQCMVVHDRHEDPLTDAVLSQILPDVRSYVMLRLLMDDTHYGVACFYANRRNVFNDQHAAIVRSLHNPIASIVGCSLAVYYRETGDEINAEYQRLQKEVQRANNEPIEELIRHAPSLVSITDAIRRVAPYDATVIISGESGSGKEVVATTIQKLSRRNHAPFVRINCAALPPSLIESELFGFERGAFTGARERHAGLFEQADGGTLFLDEMGELPLEVQAKLLRVLQGQSFRRVGGDKEVTVDVRIICATHRDLKGMIDKGRFREDLYYRLSVFPIAVPSLRDRPEDIEPLATYFIRRISKRYGISMIPRLSEEALVFAKSWPWPGNVRELRNVMERAVLSGEPIIRRLDVSLEPVHKSTIEPNQGSIAPLISAEDSLPSFEEMQRRYFKALLTQTQGRISGKSGAADIAGMHPNTLRSRLEKLGITIERQCIVK